MRLHSQAAWVRLRPLFALPFAILSGACSSGGSGAGRSSVGADTEPNNSGASSGPSVVGGATAPTDAGSAGVAVTGGGSCPARADAAVCPAIPSVVAPPVPPPNAPQNPDLGTYWVGCEATTCSSATACTTCSCVEVDGGAAWECADNGGFQPETDAQPTPYCALYSGPLDAGDIADVGPVEQCTPQYSTCTGPYPESPGWQCCLISSAGSITEIACMPNDAAAYGGGFPHP
jgi:hypothetical protein